MKKVLFITGTRADYGKIKSLMNAVVASEKFELLLFVTGMHLSEEHGSTYRAVLADGWPNVHVDYASAGAEKGMAQSLGTIIKNLANYIRVQKPDLVVVHGDRIEAMAGACAAVLQNVRVAHIEGGEISGTIDETLRHAITKLSNDHFVANNDAAKRVQMLGECPERIYTIGSPDIDIMVNGPLPSLEDVKNHYEISFDQYAIVMFHPVTTRLDSLRNNVNIFVDSLMNTDKKYIVIYPNNDIGYETILNAYQPLFSRPNQFRIYPSIRFESFLTLLKNSQFLIGNSSAGVREAGVYGIPAIDIGERQKGRYRIGSLRHIQHVNFIKEEILNAIIKAPDFKINSQQWGDGCSADRFVKVITQPKFWDAPIEKRIQY